ncbi:Uncharacterized protein Adt_37785 [Abeliophyllum distichum]|uniref:Uncharacterized protein n=1 Tax=Abeliophyllum distichum TaxID=126358 RepID=A0ABD1Q1A8_9LAMI
MIRKAVVAQLSSDEEDDDEDIDRDQKGRSKKKMKIQINAIPRLEWLELALRSSDDQESHETKAFIVEIIDEKETEASDGLNEDTREKTTEVIVKMNPKNRKQSCSSSEKAPEGRGCENLDVEPIDDTQDAETSQVSEVAQEEANMVRGLCNFDLNQEVYSQDTHLPGNQISTTIALRSDFSLFKGQ